MIERTCSLAHYPLSLDCPCLVFDVRARGCASCPRARGRRMPGRHRPPTTPLVKGRDVAAAATAGAAAATAAAPCVYVPRPSNPSRPTGLP